MQPPQLNRSTPKVAVAAQCESWQRPLRSTHVYMGDLHPKSWVTGRVGEARLDMQFLFFGVS